MRFCRLRIISLLLWDGQTYTGTRLKILWPKRIWSFHATFSNIFSSIISAWSSMSSHNQLLLQLSQISVLDFFPILYIKHMSQSFLLHTVSQFQHIIKMDNRYFGKYDRSGLSLGCRKRCLTQSLCMVLKRGCHTQIMQYYEVLLRFFQSILWSMLKNSLRNEK
jgi:hypothetical protein